ncbi:dynamin family protein [candidate division KSB1 bacterium]
MGELVKVTGIKKSVLEIIDDFISLSPPETMKDHVIRLRENILNENFQIAVVATWNTGKSTFLNALQGDPIFPTQNKETTHIISRLTYSKDRYVSLMFNGRDSLAVRLAKDILEKLNRDYTEKSENQIYIPCRNYKEQKQILEIFSTDDGFLPKYHEIYLEVFYDELHEEFPDLPDIAEEYKNVKENPDISAQEEIINKWSHITNIFKVQCIRKIQNHLLEVILGISSRLCEQGVQLIDTPGVVSLNELRDKMVTDYIQFAQCVIFIFRFDQPGNTEDITFRNFIKKMGINDVFLVLNRVDTQKDPRDVWDAISQVEKGLQSIVSGEIHIYPLSSLGTLIASLRASKNAELIKEGEEFSEFLKRTDKVQLDSYMSDFGKFYKDLDNYLLRVDKFDRLMKAPLLFLNQKIKELNQIWIDKRKEQEKDFFYKRYTTYLKDLVKIEKELSTQKGKMIADLDEIFEKENDGELYRIIADSIKNFSNITKEDWKLMSRSGFQLTFKHLLTTIEKETIEEINSELFQNKKYQHKLEDLKTALRPYYDIYVKDAIKLVNILLNKVQEEVRKLHNKWNKQLKDYFERLFPISLPPFDAETLKIEELKKPSFRLPKASMTGKVKSKVSSILTLNKAKRLESLKNQTSEIMDYVYKNNQSEFSNGISKNIEALRNIFLGQLEKECVEAIEIFKEHYKEDEMAGKKVIDKIEGINSQIKDIENLKEKIELAIEKLPPG